MKLKITTRQRRNHIPAQGNALGKPAPQSFALKGQHITCVHCGHIWQPLDPEDTAKSLESAQINGQGPFCALCRTLEESIRFALGRKLGVFAASLHDLRLSLKSNIAENPSRIIEELVIAKLRERRARGLSKYGVGMERSDLTHVQWLKHAQEEAMDLAVYLEKLIQSPSLLPPLPPVKIPTPVKNWVA